MSDPENTESTSYTASRTRPATATLPIAEEDSVSGVVVFIDFVCAAVAAVFAILIYMKLG